MQIPLTPHDLLQAAKQLKADEFSRFFDALLIHRAQQSANILSEQEATLLQNIQAGLPPAQQSQYQALQQKQEDETLSAQELAQLQDFNQQIEALNVKRTTYLIELAQLRQVSLPQLMHELGLDTPSYA